MSARTYFRRQLQTQKSELVSVGMVLFLQAIVTVLLPLPMMVLVDGILEKLATNAGQSPLWPWVKSLMENATTDDILTVAAVSLVTLTLVSAILEFAERVGLTRVAYGAVERLREDLLGQLLTRRLNYLDRKRKADLVARLSSDAGTLEYLIMSGMGTLVRSLPTLILFFILLVSLNPMLTLLLLVTLPLPYWMSLSLSRVARSNMNRVRLETQHFESEAARMLSAAPAIKALTLETFVQKSLHDRLEQIGSYVLNLRRADGALVAILSGSRHLLRAVLLVLGGYLMLKGSLTLGELTVFLLAVGPLSRAVASIAQFITDLGRAESSIARVESLVEELKGQEEIQGSQAFISLPFPDATTLHFENVSFAYSDSPFLFEKFSGSFQAGELIALVGPSGSGRTTFGRLMNRLVDPIQGKIMLGRTDIRRFRLEVLRSYVTVIDHEPFFAPATVRENLVLGTESTDLREQEISEALHAANAYDFVQGLPEGLDTIIGEGGFQLSSSQQRRLNLARAFIRDGSQIFVFDEPTLGLDPDSVSSVTTAIHQLAERGAMVFWITNRLEEIPQADRVALFTRAHNPRIGSHQELMESDATYRSYFTPMEPLRTRKQEQPQRPLEET